MLFNATVSIMILYSNFEISNLMKRKKFFLLIFQLSIEMI
jgi:hypothetical protein